MVILEKLTEIAVKRESAEGVPETITAAEVIPALTPTWDSPPDFVERESSGASLSPDLELVGRIPANVGFAMDLVGSRTDYQVDTIEPPPWAEPFYGAGHQLLTIAGWYVGVSSVVGEFDHLEQVDWNDGSPRSGTSYGIVRGDSAGRAWMFISGATQPAEGVTITGATSGATADTDVVGVANSMQRFAPVSQPTATLPITTVGSFAGWDPQDGDIVVKIDGGGNVVEGLNAAALRVVGNHTGAGSAMTLTLRPLLGSLAATDLVAFLDIDDNLSLQRVGGGDATVDAGGLTAEHLPSMTIQHLNDGLISTAVGCRGSVGLSMEAGGPGRINFTYEGGVYSIGAGSLLGASLPSIAQLPRFESGICAIDDYRFHVRSVDFAQNNTIVQLPSGNAANGIRGTAISNRRPVFNVLLDAISPGVYDFHALQRNTTPADLYLQVGSDISNRIIIHAPRCQVGNIQRQAQDGVVTFNLELLPKRGDGSAGDDEYYWYSL